MRVALFLAVAFLLAGCAPAYYQPSGSGAGPITQTSPIALEQSRVSLREKRQQLSQASQQEEVDNLKKDIEELEVRIAELERQQDAASVSPSPGYSGSGSAVQTGPRGGKYTISPSGKKQYIRRK